MSNLHPSIFNDVIGPVMRGASSSHCAAALRIGRIARDLMAGCIDHVLVEFDTGGSLATTHESHGSDMGLWGGLLGWDATCNQLPESAKALREAGMSAEVRIGDFGDSHPNTYRLTLKNSNDVHTLIAISTGGGMIEVLTVDDVELTLCGDYFETLLFIDPLEPAALAAVESGLSGKQIIHNHNDCTHIVQVRGSEFVNIDLIDGLKEQVDGLITRNINPVVPVLTNENTELPFLSCREMLEYNQEASLQLWELAVKYESARGGISENEVFAKMREIVQVMREAIATGVKGTEYDDRILGWQSGQFKKQMELGALLDGGMLNSIILAATATMEVKSSMGLVVAAPTAGSCGVLPGACLGAAYFMRLPDDDGVKAILAAGLIGVFIAESATFSAEVGGCQAECGSASGMAAAGLVTLAGGSVEQAVTAAAMALQSTFGMVCDPIANRVEAPCLGKNVLAAANALSAANMGLANFDALIPFDEVVAVMYQVGKSLPHELRCTALGGLSITKTSQEIENRLSKKQ